MFDQVIKGGTVVDGTGAPAYTADIAVRDGRIVEIGSVDAGSASVIEADGAVVAPGWVDVHTHYDGQVTWDDHLEGSATNGVTTVVMGNCGVGFAPVAPGGTQALIELMEGVEDIPGTALHEGMPWGAWESFPDYLDLLAGRRWTVDVGAQLAHGALRYYVMGDRGADNLDATADDLARMAQLTQQAMEAGALGFSTSRTIGHRSITGQPVPGTFAAEDELSAIAEAMGWAGRGVFEAIPSGAIGKLEALGGEHHSVPDEVEMLSRLSKASGRPVTFTTVQISSEPDTWRDVLAATARANAAGALLHPQVAARSVSVLTSLSAYHLFMRRRAYLDIAHLPLAERVARMRQPETRAAILASDDVPPDRAGSMQFVYLLFQQAMGVTFSLRAPCDYEPTPDRSFAAIAAATGREPQEVMYDFLLEDEGQAFAVVVGSNFVDSTLETCREMLLDPNTVTGLSDAGAHVNFICDLSMPTFHLTHWVRDRTRGERLPIEFVVAKQSAGNARLYGLHDRGTLEVGKRADVNVIDLDRLTIHPPLARQDLPAGGSRVLQPSTGYLATMVSGVVTRRHDADTGARPGRLVRAL